MTGRSFGVNWAIIEVKCTIIFTKMDDPLKRTIIEYVKWTIMEIVQYIKDDVIFGKIDDHEIRKMDDHGNPSVHHIVQINS